MNYYRELSPRICVMIFLEIKADLYNPVYSDVFPQTRISRAMPQLIYGV